jgi:hypothetical protein
VVFHLGAGVPQDREVALHPLVIEAHFFSPGSSGFDVLGKQSRKPMQCLSEGQPERCNDCLVAVALLIGAAFKNDSSF